ncbi:diguanylate cyclase domain-containing protein [Demequina sp. SO4-18]|uniref:bifunctional diguanylate cyclase/phosphodiesterase n=1 Tax=Demequina sp. SO4-18 TaxID=3401026 RepID=UPI003B5B9DF3
MKVRQSSDELLRLDKCALEPIRVPGAIQPHGALLCVDLESFEVLQASENAIDVLGVAAAALVGSHLGDLSGDAVVEDLRAVLDDESTAANPVSMRIGDRGFDVVVHRADGLGLVEFEPAGAGDDCVAAVHSAVHRLGSLTSVSEVYEQTATELKRLTGFDRVVVYKFHADGHGEVVAERAEEGMERYLGLHFPASDIPSQARELYLSQLSRMIILDDEQPAALVPPVNPVTGESLDLGHAQLRSVSPHHVEFMRNMGQVTTMSLSMVYVGRLIGMVTCSHRSPMRLRYAMRQAYEVLARQVAMQLGAVAEIERLTHLHAVRSVRARVGRQVKTGTDIRNSLFNGEFTLLDLIPADGATLRLDGVATSMGEVPDAVVDHRLLEELAGDEEPMLVSDALSEDYPELHALMPEVAGLLVVPFGGQNDCLAWFRKESISTVHWLGDQSAANRSSPLAPRNSFAKWGESVAGRSEPWDQMALIEASEIRHDLNAAMLRVAESELARVALHDPLTGLPNRRLLNDRMGDALAKRERGTPAALLFADLDSFKHINDTEGHGTGDAVIVAVAERIRAITRTHDILARVGGDEFVVLCEEATAEDADAAAARILEAFSTPIEVGGRKYDVGASIGVALAEPGQSPDDLLRAADAAMYRAKDGGRGRASR